VPTRHSNTVSKIEPVRTRQPSDSRHPRSSYRYESRVRRYKIYIALISLFFLIALFFMWLDSNNDSSEYHQAILDMRKQEVVTKKLATELETVKAERDILVQQRIPGLIPLLYDETINVDNKYVRNIIFTLAKSGKKNIYEYRLVLHNNTLTVARPKAEIILFNNIGIQIGMAQIEQSDATIEIDGRAALDPGEVRSYTAAIDLIRDEEPSYFLLIISESKHTATDKLREQLDGVILNN
jgi:hypothetical protein